MFFFQMHLEGTTGYKPLPFLFKGATDGHLTPELTDPLFSKTKSKSLLRKYICVSCILKQLNMRPNSC